MYQYQTPASLAKWRNVSEGFKIECVSLEPGTPFRRAPIELTEPSVGEVQIEVAYCGVSYVDALLARGGYQIRIEPPFVPGGEIAGQVTAFGPDVRGLRLGDSVVANVGIGGLASHVTTAASRCVLLPGGFDLAVAASLPQSFGTMWFAFTRRSPLTPGQRVLVLGAGGALGQASVAIAHSLGAHVIAAASDTAKLDLARAAGADDCIDYGTESLRSAMRARFPEGADVVVDPVGGTRSEEALRSLAPDGNYLVVGYASGDIPCLPANRILMANKTVVGVDIGWLGRTDPNAVRDLLGEVVREIAELRIVPPRPNVHAVADVDDTFRSLSDGTAIGRTVVRLVP